MKRKILSITAVIMVCLCSMFMFTGCGLTETDETNRYGTLTCGKTEVVTFNVNEDANGRVVGDKQDYIESAGFSFAFTPPPETLSDGTKNTSQNVKLESFGNLTYKQFVAKGGSCNWDFTETKGDSTRTLTFYYCGATCSVQYKVVRKKVA